MAVLPHLLPCFLPARSFCSQPLTDQLTVESFETLLLLITAARLTIMNEANSVAQASSFLALPFEIRDMIYDFVFSNMVLRPKFKFRSTRKIAILVVCRAIYCEVKFTTKRLLLSCMRFSILDQAIEHLVEFKSLDLRNLRTLRLPFGEMEYSTRDKYRAKSRDMAGFLNIFPSLNLHELLLDVSGTAMGTMFPHDAFYAVQRFLLQYDKVPILKFLITPTTNLWAGQKQNVWPNLWNKKLKKKRVCLCHPPLRVYVAKETGKADASALLHEDEHSNHFKSNVDYFYDLAVDDRKMKSMIIVYNQY